ncbi:hypothetical protein NNO04_05205 [Citrobacter sp. Awk 4]|uniref:Uncharacterized protein n=1 Tax=Citrobacter enshiensis TaxID=2971264 RepID=A0ABT8PY82_9ENTR|nr:MULTISPECIES: hypothetical protein [Citrobacter]MCQ7059600.1 hypothetical protein [Escherichia coli]MDN8601391.1 hypothetical protein [Citrobacter enshiensis]MDA8478099.1 hypothetical protein [Citrobacter sp. Awk 4]MDK2359829.1 hypothetical protein [Citrobacter freundii]MDM2931526.1 hypothetical protein [Citrobacter sp. Cm046]
MSIIVLATISTTQENK